MLTFGRGLSPRAEAFRRATEQRKVIAFRPWGEMEGARCGSSQGTAAWAGLKRLLIRTDRQDAGKSGIGKDKMPFSACGSQLRWATPAPTEFASRRPAGARSPLLPPGTTPSTTVTILPDARGERLYPPLTFGELRRFPSRAVPMLMVRADQRELVCPYPKHRMSPLPRCLALPGKSHCQRLRPARAEPAWGNRTATRLLTAGGAHRVKESVLESLR